MMNQIAPNTVGKLKNQILRIWYSEHHKEGEKNTRSGNLGYEISLRFCIWTIRTG